MPRKERVEQLISYAKDIRTNNLYYVNVSKSQLANAKEDLDEIIFMLDSLLEKKANLTLYGTDVYDSALKDLRDVVENQVYSQGKDCIGFNDEMKQKLKKLKKSVYREFTMSTEDIKYLEHLEHTKHVC